MEEQPSDSLFLHSDGDFYNDILDNYNPIIFDPTVEDLGEEYTAKPYPEPYSYPYPEPEPYPNRGNLNINSYENNPNREVEVPIDTSPNEPITNGNSAFSQASGFPSVETALKMCNGMTEFEQMKEYLQKKITGRKNIRFNKKKLFFLFNVFVQNFGWKKLTREETRNKDLIFKRLFDNKLIVVSFIESFPSVIAQVLLSEGTNK